MSFQPRNVYWAWLSVLVIVLDQISKQLVVRHMDWFEVRPLLPFLNLVHMKNTGAAFSMFTNASPVIFVLLATAVSVGILLWLRRHPSGQTLVAIGASLIMGGALGNAIDRVTRGHVVDFIDFYVGNWHFAAFNIADSAISCGAALLLLDMLLDARRQREAGKVGS
ncbi:signal peptidase II [Solimonas aquatica]|uniref:Lipoprotein signal peptidase n=1 Tax=Solimonas aquatica TaxID=489703 RepID=A0A1H9DNZ2_9GAMM|nr:signal peptidase II [Solimonas aquatica]SEQ15129.1 signal peptidase II [Solimonas aquatica]